MSETMIERVARAIHAANVKCLIMRFHGLDASECAYEGEVADDHRTLARAAIEAMREPDDDIVWAMNDVAIDGPGYVSFYPSFADCKTLFNAAIDAALSQSPHSLPSEDR